MNETRYKDVVGYVGLGDMGSGIATHLVEVGVRLVVFDLNPEAIAAVVAKGAKSAGSLEELAATSDVIIVCVDPQKQVVRVVDQLAEFLGPGQTVIIQSSVSPAAVIEMGETMAQKGVKLFDAPVSGSHEDRRNGTLSVLTGATAEGVEAERALLESIGRPLYLDALGGGEVAKLANNAIMTVTRLATIESLEFGRAFGVSEENLAEAIKISSGGSWVLDNWEYFDEQLRSGFTLRMSSKQSREIIETAENRDVHMRMTEAALQHSKIIHGARYAHLTGQEPQVSASI